MGFSNSPQAGRPPPPPPDDPFPEHRVFGGAHPNGTGAQAFRSPLDDPTRTSLNGTEPDLSEPLTLGETRQLTRATFSPRHFGTPSASARIII
ncbi:hypothetical protein J7T55_003083 [Diaporthe amygdali]|uniref:uncharacterized protein n=1 Tax=Phomopsis amygdali TaxID=1214568 RepID=UPI0022FF0AA9|nr:uncharacterized protein J7T55_003083 [Diaporthe amygdali]KAJ0122569.1 hypothetical protein J7T55_003083 [Diaporthe amygdali]